ncbi:GTPase [Parahaliea aestuarii]|uniref:GTPase n=1 Tax=Parahaliea aestuarii TaxID=1852021 RepID=A0A5C8ZVI5_9GAMM|nr:GTPase [Parahaliea aestuarii]TXS92533.1 GTPase [Parahaliea aestuarii]
MSENAPIKLRIPRQDLTQFKAFALDAGAAGNWAKGLPTSDLRVAVSQLRETVGELNRVELAPGQRQSILEALCPTLQTILQQLSRLFLNQPLVLPETSRQLAELTESLLSLISTGYTLVAVHTIQRVGGEQPAHPARLACEALQRAIQFAGQRMLQTFQLYQHLEPQSWLTLHQLYALGERQQLAKLPVRDLQGHDTTLTEAWLSAVMLGCCQPNQLRQSDLTAIYRALQQHWGPMLRLHDEKEDGPGQFEVDLHSDQPPSYSRGDTSGTQLRYIDTSGLMAHLQQLREQERRGYGRHSPLRELALPISILDHLIAALSPPSQRNFSRRAGNASQLEVAVGLSSAHYHCAGERTFSEFLPPHLAGGGQDDNPFASRSRARDIWEESESDDIHRGEADSKGRENTDVRSVDIDPLGLARIGETGRPGSQPPARFTVYRAEVLNASPGGYCLNWSDPNPVNLRSGDILCVRETGQVEWVIATVRWISAMESSTTLIGLELLSPRAMPYGARVMGPGGELSRPIRVLLLPEIKLVGKPHTLVTPRTGFHERQRVVLLGDGEEFLVQLLRQVSASSSYSQFDFRYIRELEKSSSAVAEEITMPRSPFDSLWSQL